MDIQLKKGLLEVCVLATLYKKDSYGYDMIKEISECVDISESTLYPILRRLQSLNYLSTYNQEHNGRLRKYYQMTAVGKQRLKEFKAEWEQFEKIRDFIYGRMCNG